MPGIYRCGAFRAPGCTFRTSTGNRTPIRWVRTSYIIRYVMDAWVLFPGFSPVGTHQASGLVLALSFFEGPHGFEPCVWWVAITCLAIRPRPRVSVEPVSNRRFVTWTSPNIVALLPEWYPGSLAYDCEPTVVIDWSIWPGFCQGTSSIYWPATRR